ncbi:MAG: spore germination protein [Clostridia bacterium]|nr:spore germination protein [Clostridia bacterium]
MNIDQGKISLRQAMLLFVVLFCAPAIRYIPIFTATQAKTAAWLCPVTALILEMVYVIVLSKFLKKYQDKSYVDIIKDILGKFFGKVVCIMYFLWITLLVSYNVRMYGERIVATAMPNVSIIIIILAMLLIVTYVVREGIVPLSRMNEIFYIVLAIIFILCNILIIPNLDFNNLFPITYKDAFPIFKGGLGILAIFAYSVIIFLFNDRINSRDGFKSTSIKVLITLIIVSSLVIIVPLCVFGWSILTKMPIPYLSTMMEISLFDFIERIEAGIIVFWILTDFILISVFTYTALHMIKVGLKVSNTTPFLIIYVLIIFFLSLCMAKSVLELTILSERILTQMNIVMGYALPILIFVIGKIRKKL